MAQVALNWVATRPGVASAIVGASNADQLDANMAALDFDLPAELLDELDEARRRATPVGLPDVHAGLSELAGQSGRQGRGQAGRICPRRTELGIRTQRLTDFARRACGGPGCPHRRVYASSTFRMRAAPYGHAPCRVTPYLSNRRRHRHFRMPTPP
ncbi:hypothetical protein GCM10020219_002430 [Nonomuraea dietziae]